MPKMLDFLEKAGKIAEALGAPPPNSRWPLAVGGFSPKPVSCHSHSI